jgi:DNA-binding NarL/FixJ family response regulator
MVASLREEHSIFSAVQAGARGFLLRRALSAELAGSVRTLASGGSVLDPAATQLVLDRVRGKRRYREDPRLAALSPQEERILERLDQGKTTKMLGAELHLSPGTVRNYISRIYSKLGVRSRAEGVAYLARETRREVVAGT